MTEKAKSRIKIELTPEQREQVRQLTGVEASGLELAPETLEERDAPLSFGGLYSSFTPTDPCYQLQARFIW